MFDVEGLKPGDYTPDTHQANGRLSSGLAEGKYLRYGAHGRRETRIPSRTPLPSHRFESNLSGLLAES